MVALAGCAGPSEEEDADLAYCLSTTQRARLVEAAAALGLVQPGQDRRTVRGDDRDVPLETWRAQNEQNEQYFDRACTAIRPVGQQGSVRTALIGLANVAAGGLIALVSAVVVNRVTRRRDAAAQVRAAARRLARAVDAVVSARTGSARGGPTDEALLDRLSALDAALYQASAAGATATDALVALDTLADLLNVSWGGAVGPDTLQHGETLRARATEAGAAAEVAASSLDRRRPWYLTLRELVRRTMLRSPRP